MADERIVLSYDPAEAVAAADKANRAIEANEKTAERAGAAIGKATDAQATAIVSIADRSQAAINRIVQQAERKAALTASSPAERLQAEKLEQLRRVSGDPAATNRVTAAYEKLELAARKANDAMLLQSAVAASKAAAKGADEFTAALNRTNAAAQREREAIEQEIRTLERRAAVISKTPAQKIAMDANQMLAGFNGKATPEQLGRMSAAVRQLMADQERAAVATQTLGGSLLELGTKFGIVIGAADLFKKAIEIGGGAVVYAAQVQSMGVALDAVAAANGVAESTARSLEAQLVKSGITTYDARKAIASMIAAQLDYTKATQLGVVAQNLGRTQSISTAEAFQRLTHAIITQQPEMLRMLGLNVNLQREFQLVARASGRSAESLGELEKKQITLNAVLEASASYAGVYKKSIADVGGQMLSLERYVLEAYNAFGKQFLPELALVVKALTYLGKEGKEAGENLAWVVRLAGAWVLLHRGIMDAATELGKYFRTDAAWRKEAEQIAATVRQQKVLETTTKALREQEEIRERAKIAQIEAEKKQKEDLLKFEERAADFRRYAELQEVEGLDRIALKRKQQLDELGKTPRARADIERGIAVERARFLSDFDAKRLKEFEKFQASAARTQRDSDAKGFEEKAKAYEEIAKIEESTQRINADRAIASLEARKSSELRAVQEVTGKGLEERLAAEDRVQEIERSYALKIFQQKVEYIHQEAALRAALATSDDAKAAILNEAAARALALSEQAQAAMDAAQETSAIRKMQLVRSEQQKAFDTVRQAADGVFDSLATRVRSLGDLLKVLILQPLLTMAKQISSTAIATILTGGNPSQGGGGAGLFARLGFGALTSGGVARAGAPGGTPGFAGPVSGLPGIIGGGQGGVGGGLGVAGGLAGLKASSIGILSSLGNIGAPVLGAGSTGGAMAGGGIYGAKGGGLLLGGGILAADGLRRGGALGLAETTAGGALIGLKFGGPMGALIGGAIGAAAGTVRFFIKGAQDKLKDKIQSMYGVRMADKAILGNILSTIKSGFGGDIEAGIRSPQIRDLIELYAMSTGQKYGGVSSQTAMAMVSQRNGMLTQIPQYGWSGQQLAGLGGAIAQGGVAAGPVTINLQLDGQATTQVMRGEAVQVVQDNPRLVAQAGANASRDNFRRRENTLLGLKPGLLAV